MLLLRLVAVLVLTLVTARADAGAPANQPEPGHAPKPAARRRGPVPEGVRALRNITFATVGERQLKLDLFLPDAPDSSAPLPVILWIHGGGWEAGNKEQCPAIPLANRGYAVVSTSYRLTNVAPFPAQIHDCKAAVRWIRAHARDHNLDAEHIGVWGASAGGHLAALLGTSWGVKDLEGEVGGNLEQSSRVQAVCDWFGPTDLVRLCRLAMTIGEDDGTKGTFDSEGKRNGKHPKTPPIFRKLLGGEIQDKMELCVSANPITHAGPGDAPTLIFHGDKDPLVPLSQSELLVEALRSHKIAVELRVIKEGGHGFWSDDLLNKVAAFFDAHLKTSPRPPASSPGK